MGRIRTVKPGFWKHEDLSDLAPETHMLACALLNYADDEGYFNANPKLVKAECCPLREDSVSVQDSLNELKKIGFITTGIGSDGKTYGCVEKFTEHQRINRPTPSNIAKLGPFTESSVSTHGVLTDGKEGKGKERKGREGNCTQIAFDQFVDMAQRVGLSVPQNLNARRTANLDRRLQECGGLDGWRHALDKIENSDFLSGKSTNWKADFDFVIKAQSFTKIMEGSYDNHMRANEPDRVDDARAVLDAVGLGKLDSQHGATESCDSAAAYRSAECSGKQTDPGQPCRSGSGDQTTSGFWSGVQRENKRPTTTSGDLQPVSKQTASGFAGEVCDVDFGLLEVG